MEGREAQKAIYGSVFSPKVLSEFISNRASFPADDNDFLPVDLLQTHRQVILHKRCIDPFDEPRIERLLSEVQADEFYGSSDQTLKELFMKARGNLTEETFRNFVQKRKELIMSKVNEFLGFY